MFVVDTAACPSFLQAAGKAITRLTPSAVNWPELVIDLWAFLIGLIFVAAVFICGCTLGLVIDGALQKRYLLLIPPVAFVAYVLSYAIIHSQINC